MQTRHRLAAGSLVALLVLAACAKTQVTQRQEYTGGRLARPDHIFVYDFAATPEEVPVESALSGHASVADVPQTPDATKLARQLGAEIAHELVARIDAMGLPAEYATSASQPRPGDLVIRGTLLSVQAGSAVERVAIGLGKGNAELKTAVEGFVMTEQGLRKLGSGEVASGDGKAPGAALPLAVAVATKNPLGLIVSTGVKLGEEETGASTIQGKAKDTADEIAKQLKPRFEQQGWIP